MTTSGQTWKNFTTAKPPIDGGVVVGTRTVAADGSIGGSVGTPVTKILGSDGLRTRVSLAQSSVVAADIVGRAYNPSGLNAVYGIQGLAWSDAVSVGSSYPVTGSDIITGPFATAYATASGMFDASDNIIGFHIGHKIVGGVETADEAVVFVVAAKLPLDLVPLGDVIPSHIDGIPTDVVQGSIAQACAGFSQSEIINMGSVDGTLGIACVDDVNGGLVFSSCNHVAAKGYVAGDPLDFPAGAVQPTTVEGVNPWSALISGVSTAGGVAGRTIRMKSVGYNYADFSTFGVSAGLKDAVVPQVYGLKDSLGADVSAGPFPWASESEIALGATLFAHLRQGQGDVSFTVTAVNASTAVAYYGGLNVILRHMIYGSHAAIGGQSGTPVFGRFGGVVKYVGNIVAAVSGQSGICLAAYQYALGGVKAWNGDVVLAKRNTPTLAIFGRTYEFKGYTTAPITHSDAVIGT